jgi:hypothetical protein
MVSLLFLSRGLRKEEYREKKRKREKRNEIQCMILLKSLIFVSTKSESCLKKVILITLKRKFYIISSDSKKNLFYA